VCLAMAPRWGGSMGRDRQGESLANVSNLRRVSCKGLGVFGNVFFLAA